MVVATITLLVAGGVATGFALANRPAAVILTAQSTSVDTDKHAVPPPATFDHFDFSNLWLAFSPQPSLPIHGQAAYLVDLDARQVMWARDPETSRAPASLTKLITAMVAVDDAGALDRKVVVAKEAVQVIPSGFIRQMNQKAKSIGLTASHFVNPSGLDAQGHGMSAHDLAHTAAYLDQYYPELANIAATKDVEIAATPQHKAFYPHNLNPILWSYAGATGLKTGLTGNAGGCIVATATRGGRHLIAVVLNATLHSAADATVLLNYGFSVKPHLPLPS